MLKWLVVGCVVIILVVGIVAYAGYQQVTKIAEQGPTVSVAIAATPERVFASMANADSLSSWFMPGTSLRTTRKGSLVAGDSIFITSARGDSMPTAWVIDTLVPNQVIASHWTTLRNGIVIQRRRDSLSMQGDSTVVISTVRSTVTDSMASARSRSGGVTGGLLDMSATFGTAGARMQTEQDLRRLKSRIEGPKPVRP